MTFEGNFNTPTAAGALICGQRMSQGLTQQSFADEAGVSRKFIIDLESGHERAELGKTMAVLGALGLSLSTTPIPRGSEHDPERRDYAAHSSKIRTGLRHWRESPITPLTGSTKPPRLGPNASGP
jgi:y4mF family transcriptional regulator